jgi:hypothetical protein
MRAFVVLLGTVVLFVVSGCQNQRILIPRPAPVSVEDASSKPKAVAFASLRMFCPQSLVLMDKGLLGSTVYQYAAKEVLEGQFRTKLGERWEMVQPQDMADRYLEVTVQTLQAEEERKSASVVGTFLFTMRDEKKDVLLNKSYTVTQNSTFDARHIPDAFYRAADQAAGLFMRDAGDDDFLVVSAKGVSVTPICDKNATKLSDELISEALVASGFTVLRPQQAEKLQDIFFSGTLSANQVMEVGKIEKTPYFVTVSTDWQNSRSGMVALQVIDAETGRVLGAGSMSCGNTATSIRYACHNASRKLVRYIAKK